MVSESPHDPDPQELLPASLRAAWAVVPRATLYWLFIAGALLGAGAAVSVVGFATGDANLRYGWPIGFGVAALVGRIVYARVEDRRIASLRGRTEMSST